mgnify:CR=1 FL=1
MNISTATINKENPMNYVSCLQSEMVRKFMMMVVAVAAALGAFAAAPTISNVTAKQRYPWNGLVDIDFTVTGLDGAVTEIDGATNGLAFAVTAVMPDGSTNRLSHLKVARRTTGGDCRIVWDARADLGEVRITNLVANVAIIESHKEIQLWEGGPYWADCNVGAEKPEDFGYYFWWGDTVGYKRENNAWVAVDGSSAHFWFNSSNAPTCGKDNAALLAAGYIDSAGNLAPEHDAATAHFGAPWRMPTDAEFSALLSNCTTTWTTRNGVSGRLITGKGDYADRSIFLPASGSGLGSGLGGPGSGGCYWSSTPSSDYSYYAWRLFFDSDDFYRYYNLRFYGFPVRPLRGFAD